MSADSSQSDISPVYLKLPPEKIVHLKFILETYEGIGELRTLSNMTGEVVVLTTLDQLPDLRGLLKSLEKDLSMREIPQPPSLEGDWLLAEQ